LPENPFRGLMAVCVARDLIETSLVYGRKACRIENSMVRTAYN
jgi:hypothetical protein